MISKNRSLHLLLRTIVICFLNLLSINVHAEKEIDLKDFQLLNVDGKVVSLKDYTKAKGFIIIFTCNHCHFAKLYPKRMNQLNEKYNMAGIPLLAISSTDTLVYEEDNYANMIAKSIKDEINFPYLLDGDQKVAKAFGAQKTPHAFIIWKENGKFIIKYSGAIDDNGAEPDKVKNQYVDKAAEALLAGKEVEIKETMSIGCQIHFRK